MKSIIQERNHGPILAKQEKMQEEAKVNAKKNKQKIEEVWECIKLFRFKNLIQTRKSKPNNWND